MEEEEDALWDGDGSTSSIDLTNDNEREPSPTYSDKWRPFLIVDTQTFDRRLQQGDDFIESTRCSSYMGSEAEALSPTVDAGKDDSRSIVG